MFEVEVLCVDYHSVDRRVVSVDQIFVAKLCSVMQTVAVLDVNFLEKFTNCEASLKSFSQILANLKVEIVHPE